MPKKLALALLSLLAVLAVVVSLRPAAYRVERSIAIDAAAPAVMAQVADLRNWEGWSPWAHAAPDEKLAFAGAPGAQGSSLTWSGGESAGEGKITLASATAQGAELSVHFIKPIDAENQLQISVVPDGRGARATWSYSGEYNALGKALSLVRPIDAILGPDFEKALAGLKRAAEARPEAVLRAAP